MDEYIRKKSVTVGLDYIINELNKLITDDSPNDGYTDIKNQVEEIKRGVLKLPPEDVQPVQWIPCSKRLPNDNDYNSCMECIDGAVWYLTEKGAMGLGYYYESTKQWATTDDLKTDGKVVAWMPLPEPWKGSDNENY